MQPPSLSWYDRTVLFAAPVAIGVVIGVATGGLGFLAAGALGGLAGGFAGGASNAYASGASAGQVFKSGAIGGAVGAAAGALGGALAGRIVGGAANAAVRGAGQSFGAQLGREMLAGAVEGGAGGLVEGGYAGWQEGGFSGMVSGAATGAVYGAGIGAATAGAFKLSGPALRLAGRGLMAGARGIGAMAEGLEELAGGFGMMGVVGRTPNGMARISPLWRARYGPAALRDHHLVPQELLKDNRFVARLTALGYNARRFIDQRISRITVALHKSVHPEWNKQWKLFMDATPNFTVRDIERQIHLLSEMYGIPRSARNGVPLYGR
jgi:hypothetical protein